MANDTEVRPQIQQFATRVVDLESQATAPGQWGVVLGNGPPPTDLLERLERNGWLPVFPPLPMILEGQQVIGLYVRSHRQVLPVARFQPTPRNTA